MTITLVKDEKPTGPFCEDCRWHVVQTIGISIFHLCHAPQNGEPGMELVARKPVHTGRYNCESAAVQRSAESANYCGPEGKWFEPRTSEPTSHPSEEVAA